MLREEVCRRGGLIKQLWRAEVNDFIVRRFRMLLCGGVIDAMKEQAILRANALLTLRT